MQTALFSNNYFTIFYFVVLYIQVCNSSLNISKNDQKSLTLSNTTHYFLNISIANLRHTNLKVINQYNRNMTRKENDTEPKIHQLNLKENGDFVNPYQRLKTLEKQTKAKFNIRGQRITFRNRTNVLQYNIKTIFASRTPMRKRIVPNIQTKNKIHEHFTKNKSNMKLKSFSVPGKRHRGALNGMKESLDKKIVNVREKSKNKEFIFLCRAVASKNNYRKSSTAPGKRNNKKYDRSKRTKIVNGSNERTFICTKKNKN